MASRSLSQQPWKSLAGSMEEAYFLAFFSISSFFSCQTFWHAQPADGRRCRNRGSPWKCWRNSSLCSNRPGLRGGRIQLPLGWEQHQGGSAPILGRHQAAFTPPRRRHRRSWLQQGHQFTCHGLKRPPDQPHLPGCSASSRDSPLLSSITPSLPAPTPKAPPRKNQAPSSSSLQRNWVKPGGPPPRGHVPPIAEPFPGVRAPVDKT